MNDTATSRADRFQALKDEFWERGYEKDEWPMAEEALRFVLLEKSRFDGDIYLTVHDTAQDAVDYHDGQEYPEDWPVFRLVDLDEGVDIEFSTVTELATEPESLPNLDAYHALQDVAGDHESDLLEQLAVKAGLLWKCADENGFVDDVYCGWMNTLDDTTCGGCGRPRPTSEEAT